MRKYNYFSISFVLMILGLLLITCNKYDQVLKGDHASEEKLKAWLKDNGGYYKEGNLKLESNGVSVKGSLAWEAKYVFQSGVNEYVYVPFNIRDDIEKRSNTYGITFQIDNRGNIIKGAFTVNSYNDNKVKHLQHYYTLKDGRLLNTWRNDQHKIEAITYSKLSSAQVSALLADLNKAKTKLATTVAKAPPVQSYASGGCGHRLVTWYEHDGYLDNDGTYYSIVRERRAWVLECVHNESDGGGGSNGGGGGGGGGGNGGGPPQNTEDLPYIDPDEYEDVDTKNPCDEAKRAAEKIKNAYSQQALQEKLPQLTTPSTTEKGIALYERVKVDPHDNTNITSDHHYTGNIMPGTDTSITIPITVSDLDAIIATSHYHPASGYSAPSANDIYRVIEANGYNTSQFTQGRFQGSFVEAADGSSYALKVTDFNLANTFFGTQSSNLAQNGREWNPESNIGKDFTAANDYYLRKYWKSSNRNNLAYEEAMGFVLNKYNTGITLMKKDPVGNFKPIIRTSSTTKNWLGIKTTTYINPCP